MTPPTTPTLPSVSEPQDHLPNDIAEDTLRKYFLLTDEDLIEVERCRGSGNRLGFAVQLCTLRWRGHFLPDTCSLPQPVLEILGSQLGVLAMPIPDYPQNEKTRWDHQERIRRHLGFSKCDEAQRERLFAHLRSQAVMTPRTQALSAEAGRWLMEQRVVRPGQTTLREIVGAAKEAALQQVYEQISGVLNAIQQQLLDELLKAAPITDAPTGHKTTPHSRLEQFKLLPRRASTAAMDALTTRLAEIQAVGLGDLSIQQQVHSATRALLASWGYRYDVWSLRRFAAPKRYSIVLAFLQASLAETLDAIIEMQDKLITKVHNKARERHEEVLRAAEQVRTRAVVVLEEIGSLVVDETVPDGELRARIFAQRSSDDLAKVVSECRELRDRNEGSHLNFLTSWYGYTRKYSPVLLASMPFDFTRCPTLGEAVAYLKEVNQENGRQFDDSAPTEFLARRWERYVLMDRQQHYSHLGPILTGTIRPHFIKQSWDEVVRVVASIRSRIVSPSLILHRLGSYARRNSIHQALAEIGRVYKTIWILRYLDDEPLRRRAGREFNKGEASHDLSRFLCFGKEGKLRGREFEDQLHTFSCLAVLHNAVVAWNLKHIALLVEQLRAEGHTISDDDLALTSPLVRRHINPYGRYHFDLTSFKRVNLPKGSTEA